MCARSSRRQLTAIRPQPSLAPPIRRCFASTTTTTPANGLNGVQLANPFAPGAVLGQIDRTTTRSTTTGASLQATNTDQLFGHNNHFRRRRQLRLQRDPFRGQRGTGHHRFELCRQRQRHLSRAIRRSRRDRPGLASSHQPIYRPLRARHVRRHGRVLDHGGRPLQRRAHRARGSDRHRAQRRPYLHPLQSDHRRHLQDHAGI